MCLARFIWRDVFSSHPGCCTLQDFILCYGWIIFCCVYIPQFLHPLVYCGHLGWFYIMAVVGSAVINRYVGKKARKIYQRRKIKFQKRFNVILLTTDLGRHEIHMQWLIQDGLETSWSRTHLNLKKWKISRDGPHNWNFPLSSCFWKSFIFVNLLGLLSEREGFR